MTAARRLAVGEIALRTALDEVAPVLTPEVVAAVVREYGVDPTWLLTGDYDSQTHRMALEADATRDVDAINAMVTARLTPPGGSTSVRPGGRLGA